jgi:hypothetical protein
MYRMERARGAGGFGIATMFAVMIPALILVVAIAHSFQASSVRRFTSASYMQYVQGEICESAIAEAAHLMSVRNVFPDATDDASFTGQFVQKILADGFGDLPADHREYRSILDQDGQEMQKMLLALRFEGRGQEIPLRGLAKTAAEMNPGVKVTEMKVTVRPMSFRREFFAERGEWISWGLVSFRAHVEVDDGDGPAPTSMTAIKMFTLKPVGMAGDVIEFSDRNIRTFAEHHQRHRGRRS